ncbi:MFS transporter [Nocardioides hankookensis]|uniref:MFS transporter n=1 Tax=Nocardioides hankookensis TaxID=443157 RepID=A0ABW1LGL6_9ACTN
MPSRLDRFLPPTPLARRLSVQSVLYAIGEGAFMTGSAVFFTHIVGLTAAQVGLGLTVAGVFAFAFAVPLGRLADRIGPKRQWAIGASLTAALYLLWPFIGGFSTFLVMVVVLELAQRAGWSGRGAYTLDVFPHDERVRSMAFMRAALNIGFTIGALAGGLALAFDSDAVIRAMPWVTACVLALNAWLITRLPDAAHDHPAEAPVEKAVGSSALRNRGFLVLSACNGVLETNQVLLNIVIPLWLVQETDAPHVLLAWLFGTNTVLAVLFQVPAARGVNSVDTSLRAARIGGVFFVVSCLIVLVTHDTLGWTTILLVWLGHVTVTGAELFESAAHWGFLSELSEPDRRGEYQGASQLGETLGSVWAPAAYTFLAMEWGTPGWLTIAGIVVVAVLVMTPAARSAERYLARTQQPTAA